MARAMVPFNPGILMKESESTQGLNYDQRRKRKKSWAKFRERMLKRKKNPPPDPKLTGNKLDNKFFGTHAMTFKRKIRTVGGL